MIYINSSLATMVSQEPLQILRKKFRHVIPAKGLENICSNVKDKNKRTNL